MAPNKDAHPWALPAATSLPEKKRDFPGLLRTQRVRDRLCPHSVSTLSPQSLLQPASLRERCPRGWVFSPRNSPKRSLSERQQIPSQFLFPSPSDPAKPSLYHYRPLRSRKPPELPVVKCPPLALQVISNGQEGTPPLPPLLPPTTPRDPGLG